MKFVLHTFPEGVEIAAEPEGVSICSLSGDLDLSKRENWPPAALAVPAGWRTAMEVEQLLEVGLAETAARQIWIRYEDFATIESEMAVRFLESWAKSSPFLLKIDRKSDIGRQDFEYRYQFILGGRPVSLERNGCYVQRAGTHEIFKLDQQMCSLVQAMDAFNSLTPENKTLQESWLTFAKVKGCAAEVGATLDSTLQKNDVLVPSTIGLDMQEDRMGALSFLPKCPELATQEFQQVFERNVGAEKLYSLDRPGLGRLRIVLSDDQHEVLRRMKRVRRITGDRKHDLEENPAQVFDGVMDYVELPYGERVVGIGQFKFTPIARPHSEDASMAGLWQESLLNSVGTDAAGLVPHAASSQTESAEPVSRSETPSDGRVVDTEPGELQTPEDRSSNEPQSITPPDVKSPSTKKVLLIKTNEDGLNYALASEPNVTPSPMHFQPPSAFRSELALHTHQEAGVQWLQTCFETKGRKGVLLADDMGVGKTIQILTFLAWCIEFGRFPDLAKPTPPFRPILIVVPLILLETRNWEQEMERFFADDGSIFWPVLPLHGSIIAKFRRADREGAELEIGQPVLDLKRLQQNRVVITNYDTVKNYQHSFAYCKEGQSLWSLIISDEAQEYKVPSSKMSHAMKALKADFHIACTGTPVENRLLDLWNLCDSIQPGLLLSAKDFVDRFERPIHTDNRNETLEKLKRELLYQKPHAFILRRNKSDVAKLPPKHIIKIPCPMSEADVALHNDLLASLGDKETSSKFLTVLQHFAQLSQHRALLNGEGEDGPVEDLIASSSKLQAVIRELHVIRGKREKAIIFARHRAMQRILARVLSSEFNMTVRIVNGETSRSAPSFGHQGRKTRNQILETFKATRGFDVLILSPFIAGIGLNITEANHVFHYGRWWNPAVESQATDRAYRIGQTKEVFVYIPILTDPSGRVPVTFDERLDVLMGRKFRLAEDFLKPLPPEDEIGSELIAEMRKQPEPAGTLGFASPSVTL